MTLVYKIVDAKLWREAEDAGLFTGAGIDLADGYIHLSYAHQLRETLRLWFAGRDNLVLVAADTGRLGADLRDEASRGGELFPHLYAHLPLSAVVFVRPIELGADGRHEPGADIP